MLFLWIDSGLPTMGQEVKSNSTPFNYNAIIVRSRVTTYTIIMTCITNCTRINPNATMDIKIMEMQFPRVGEIKDERQDEVRPQVNAMEVIQNKEWKIYYCSWLESDQLPLLILLLHYNYLRIFHQISVLHGLKFCWNGIHVWNSVDTPIISGCQHGFHSIIDSSP